MSASSTVPVLWEVLGTSWPDVTEGVLSIFRCPEAGVSSRGPTGLASTWLSSLIWPGHPREPLLHGQAALCPGDRPLPSSRSGVAGQLGLLLMSPSPAQPSCPNQLHRSWLSQERSLLPHSCLSRAAAAGYPLWALLGSGWTSTVVP